MQIKNYFYEWESGSILDTQIKLGDSKATLLKSNLIRELTDDQTKEIMYVGIDVTPYRVVFKDNKVTQIWYRNNVNTFEVDSINLFDKFIPEALIILNKYLKKISNTEVSYIEDIKSYTKSDVLWINAGDSIIKFITIVKSSQI